MKKISTLCVAAFISVSAFAQWDTLSTNTTTNFKSISFLDEQFGIAVGNIQTSTRGTAYYSNDGGITWNSVNLLGTANNCPAINDIAFINSTVGIAVADSGLVFGVNVAGVDFYTGLQLGTENLNCVFVVNDTTIFLGANNGMLYRYHGATTDTLNSGTNLAINDIYFIDANNGWIVGDGGYMAATADAGQTWTVVSQPYFGFFNCYGFAYAGTTNDAFAVGNLGEMIHSNDGGLNWGTYSSNTNYNLNSVRFTNDLAGIICGNHGIIYRTQDGGVTWIDESMPYVTDNLTGISWASDTLAYICGANGTVLKSHNDISAVHPIIRNNMSIAAFPNPFADVLNVSVELGKSSNVAITILDVTGRILFAENEGVLSEGKQIIHLDGISSLSGGMYFVNVKTENGEITIPVVKN